MAIFNPTELILLPDKGWSFISQSPKKHIGMKYMMAEIAPTIIDK
jgi:hypothetical protein